MAEDEKIEIKHDWELIQVIDEEKKEDSVCCLRQTLHIK